jgi:hypothetical protein
LLAAAIGDLASGFGRSLLAFVDRFPWFAFGGWFWSVIACVCWSLAVVGPLVLGFCRSLSAYNSAALLRWTFASVGRSLPLSVAVCVRWVDVDQMPILLPLMHIVGVFENSNL